jgi:hypothetical protein
MKHVVEIMVKTEIKYKDDAGRSNALIKIAKLLAEARQRLNYKAPSYTVKVIKASLSSKFE